MASRISGALLGAVTVALLVGATGVLAGLWRLVTVDTGSMRPTLNPGDIAILASEPIASVKVGQVLAFHPPGEPNTTVIHRVISLELRDSGAVIQTQGDANNAADQWHALLGGQVAWHEIARVRGVGYVAAWVQLPALRLAILVVIALLMLSLGLRRIWGET